MKKRLCSWFLVLTMVLGLLPAAIFAAETPDSIKVTMSVFDQGVPAKDENGKAVLLRELSVSDTDGDGEYSLDEALAQLHTACGTQYSAGAGDGGYSVTKLWGDESGAFCFYRNDTLTSAVNEEFLAEGDRVAAYIYKDQTNWSDRYTYFDQSSKTVLVNTEFEVELNYRDIWGTTGKQAIAPLGVLDPVSGEYSVPAALRGEEVFEGVYMTTVSTGYDGVAKFSFTEPGTYLLTVQYDSTNYTDYYQDPPRYYLVPALCQVTVLSETEYAQVILAQAAEELTWGDLSSEPADAVTVAPILPVSVQVEDKNVSVSWICSDMSGALSIYSGFAYIDRPAAQDAACTLTAEFSYEGQTTTKSFPVTVKSEGVSDDKESVSDYGDLMSGIAETYTVSADPWTVLDMAAYGQNIKSDDGYDPYASAAPKALAEAAIGGTVDLTELTGFDPAGAYAIYTAPYVLLAYDAAEADDTEFTTKRSDLKTALVTYLNALETNWADTDDVTPILAALAPYYQQGDAELDSAVTAAINWLSQRQNDDGTFSYYGTVNANSTALAVVALSALGIDAHADERFVNDKSAMDGLFSFALDSKDGFGYKGNVTKNTVATEQGFRALVAYARFMETNEAYNIYLDAVADAEAPIAPELSTTVPDGSDDNNPGGNTPTPDTDITVSFTLKTHQTTWISNLSVELKEESTVAGLIYEVAEQDESLSFVDNNGYISSITYDGETWAAFDAGSNSGWKYKVNGKAPVVGMNDRVLEDGDKVVWYYVADYTEDDTPDESDEPVVKPEKPVEEPVVLPFEDAEGHWAQEAITYCYAKSLMAGTGEATFAPDLTTSRGMIVTILYALEEKPAVSGGQSFADVDENAYYASAAAWAAENGIVSGYGDGCFGPNDEITREQMALILMNYARYKGYHTKNANNLNAYADAGQVHDWALDAVRWANAEGLMNGRGADTIAPLGTATRAEAATILMRFLENNEK